LGFGILELGRCLSGRWILKGSGARGVGGDDGGAQAGGADSAEDEGKYHSTGHGVVPSFRRQTCRIGCNNPEI